MSRISRRSTIYWPRPFYWVSGANLLALRIFSIIIGLCSITLL